MALRDTRESEADPILKEGQRGTQAASDFLSWLGTSRPGPRGGRPGRRQWVTPCHPRGHRSLTSTGCTPEVRAGPEVPVAALADG